jgi:hypothetical protein
MNKKVVGVFVLFVRRFTQLKYQVKRYIRSNSIPSPSDILGGNEKKPTATVTPEKLASATPIGSSGGAGFLRLTQIVLLQEWVNNLLQSC